VIPVTFEATNLSSKRPGDPVHVEADLVGKWIERLMPPPLAAP
jgi:riboflavin synthase alpha subunit